MLLSRAVLNAVLPPGSLWQPEDDEGLDRLLEGIATGDEAVREVLADLAHVRDPYRTRVLSDLEREYGIVPDASVTDTVRRQRLAAVQSARQGNGGMDYIQDRLRQAGFDVQVHTNDPAVDPAGFLLFAGTTIMGDSGAMFGRTGVQFGGERGELIANGPVYLDQDEVRYTLPTDPAQWPLVFFIGGDATRTGTGQLIDIADARVPSYRKAELIRLIVKLKPMSTWAGLLATYTV